MAAKNSRKVEQTAIGLTRWVGSTQSIFFHSVFFLGSFLAAFVGVISFDRMLLVLTTLVSLEAIYLAIFIQMSLNLAKEAIEEIEKDVDEIQEDVDEIQEDVEGIEKDVDEIQGDVDELQEDVEEMTEEEIKEMKAEKADHEALSEIQKSLQRLVADVAKIQNK